jgi:transcriptional regulator of acetoin/glycerol metabolism
MPHGVVVEHRGNEAEAENFKYWGTWLGGVWSEDVEGTNGIGTCFAEERPLTVHRTEHFRSRHTGLSCSCAPIFDVAGELVAALDVSIHRSGYVRTLTWDDCLTDGERGAGD